MVREKVKQSALEIGAKERRSIWMRRKHSIWLIFGGLVLGFLIWSVPKVLTWLAIDACLDRGGSWHDDVGECSFTENYRGSADRL